MEKPTRLQMSQERKHSNENNWACISNFIKHTDESDHKAHCNGNSSEKCYISVQIPYNKTSVKHNHIQPVLSMQQNYQSILNLKTSSDIIKLADYFISITLLLVG